jgi:hypothetical protein
MEGELEGQKPLPEEIVRDVLGASGPCLAYVRTILDKGKSIRNEARKRLQAEGKIRRIDGVRPLTEGRLVEGVDGSYHSVRTAALDLSLCSAVGAGPKIRHKVKVFSAPHSQHLSRACQGIMTLLELHLIAGTDSPLVIYDGSFLSALIRVNSALAAESASPGDSLWTYVGPIYDELALQQLCFHPAISNQKSVAIPKLSTSTNFVDENFPALKSFFSDRTFFSIVLDPGEFVSNQPPPEPKYNLATESSYRPPDADDVIRFFIDTGFVEVFFRPHAWSPAYKIEVPGNFPSEKMAPMLATVSDLLPDPGMLEPYPQFLADQLSRQIGVAGYALRDAIQGALYAEGADPRAVHAALSGYRTSSFIELGG